MEEVILVDNNDNEIGTMEKIQTHKLGLLHRAFSIFIFDKKGQMLIQQRAFSKYHSGGLWSNACCGHPRPNELTIDAANRRLKEEMGFETNLIKIFNFCYRTKFANNLIENEFDNVFVGYYDGEIKPNIDEINDWTYKPLNDIQNSLSQNRNNIFTVWFRIAFPQLLIWLENVER